jgi:crotonobetainyl-CoA:carnitine CoA-transferase CaiB-like acyl-CoA transferase
MTAPGPAPGLPLDGITVVSLEQAVAAPYATRQLADLGARVIKVERPGGGDFARTYDSSVKGLASYFVWLNRGKESVALDLKSAAGRSALTALIGRADVFVQNLAIKVERPARRSGWGCRRRRCAPGTGSSSSAMCRGTPRTGRWATGAPTTC